MSESVVSKKYLVPVDDGYGWTNIDCFNRPVSMIMSNFNKDFYKTYLFYVCLFHSFFIGKWYPNLFEDEEFPQKSFTEFYNDFLKEKLDIEFCTHEVKNEDDFHKNIEKLVDDGNPVIVPCDVFDLFYYYNYKFEHIEHYFVIDGYDREKQVYHILDTLHVDLAKNAVYKEFYIKYDEIYRLMNDFFKNMASMCKNKFFWYFKKINEINYSFKDCDKEYLQLIINVLSSKIDIKYIEVEAIKYIETAVKNNDLSLLESNIERIFRRSNYKKIYYDMLLDLLAELKTNEKVIGEVKSSISNLLSGWEKVRNKIVYETLNQSYNFKHFDGNMKNLIQAEIDFLREISNIIK